MLVALRWVLAVLLMLSACWPAGVFGGIVGSCIWRYLLVVYLAVLLAE